MIECTIIYRRNRIRLLHTVAYFFLLLDIPYHPEPKSNGPLLVQPVFFSNVNILATGLAVVSGEKQINRAERSDNKTRV